MEHDHGEKGSESLEGIGEYNPGNKMQEICIPQTFDKPSHRRWIRFVFGGTWSCNL